MLLKGNIIFSLSLVFMNTSYLCKPKHTMSELMKKAPKEAYGKDIKSKMQNVGNVFIRKEKFLHMKQ